MHLLDGLLEGADEIVLRLECEILSGDAFGKRGNLFDSSIFNCLERRGELRNLGLNAPYWRDDG